MKELSQPELLSLYLNFAAYRDAHCNGFARISVAEFYAKHGLEPYAA